MVVIKKKTRVWIIEYRVEFTVKGWKRLFESEAVNNERGAFPVCVSSRGPN